MGNRAMGYIFQKVLVSIIQATSYIDVGYSGLINDPANDGTKFGDKKSVPTLQGIHCVFCSSPLFCLLLQCLSNLTKNGDSLFILFQFSHYKLQMGNKHLSKWGLSVLNKVLIFIIGANVIISSLLSLHMGYISSFNYPGGDALQFTNNYILENYKNETVSVHMDVPACMTGITRFGEWMVNLLVMIRANKILISLTTIL